LKGDEGSPVVDRYGLFVESENKTYVKKKLFDKAKELHESP